MALLCPTKPSIYSRRSNLNLKFAFLMIFEIFECLRLEKKILTTYLKSHLFLHYQQTLQLVLMISTEKNKLEMRWIVWESNIIFERCLWNAAKQFFQTTLIPLSRKSFAAIKLCCQFPFKHAENVGPLDIHSSSPN